MKYIKSNYNIVFVIYTSLFLCNINGYAQVGINTIDPKTTLDVSFSNKTNFTDGIIAPRITLSDLTAKGNSLYGATNTGTIIYVTNISGGGNTGQCANITEPGYYYFNGTVWLYFNTKIEESDFGEIKESFKTTDHNGWYLLNGRSVSTLPASIQSKVNSMLGANLPNASNKSLKGKTGSEVLASTGGSNNITLLKDNLPNSPLTGNFTVTSNADGAHNHTLKATSTPTGHEHTASTTSTSVGHAHTMNNVYSAYATHAHTLSGKSSRNTGHQHNFIYPAKGSFRQLGPASNTMGTSLSWHLGQSTDFSIVYGDRAPNRTQPPSIGNNTNVNGNGLSIGYSNGWEHTISGNSTSNGGAHTNHPMALTVGSTNYSHSNHAVSATIGSGGAAHAHAYDGASSSVAAHTHAFNGTATATIAGASQPIDNRSAYMVTNTFIYLGL